VAHYALGQVDWLLLLRDGRFDASPSGFAFISFTEGLVNYPAEAVKDLFFDPEAVRKTLATIVG